MELTVRRTRDALEISFVDDGPNPLDAAILEGTGLSNTRRRLATLYGPQASLTLRTRAEGGTEALLGIPVPDGFPVLGTAEHEIRDALGLKPGDAVVVHQRGNQVIIESAASQKILKGIFAGLDLLNDLEEEKRFERLR